jgi:hypothetical protein
MPHYPMRAETHEMRMMRDQTETGIVLTLAEVIAIKYQVALTLLRSGKPHLVRKGEVLEREYARQLTLLTHYADEVLL